MLLGRVIGTLVATRRVPGLDGVRFLVVEPTTPSGAPDGPPIIAADPITSSGPGETVWYTTSREAALAMPDTFVPIDAAIVGIVDQVHEPAADPEGSR